MDKKIELGQKIVNHALMLRNACGNGKNYNDPDQVVLDDIEQIREYLDELEEITKEDMEERI